MKPLPLIAFPIRNSSQENGIVLDLFGGSGSTLIAAEQLNRSAYLMEIDPKYASAIVRRYIAYNRGTEGIQVIRYGKQMACRDIYVPTEQDFAYSDESVNEIQSGDFDNPEIEEVSWNTAD